jgi:hypothetical protein
VLVILSVWDKDLRERENQRKVRAFPMGALTTTPEWDADVMMARPALQLAPEIVELPRFELDWGDEDATLEIVRTEEIRAEDVLETVG